MNGAQDQDRPTPSAPEPYNVAMSRRRPFATALVRGIVIAALTIAWLAILLERPDPPVLAATEAGLSTDGQRVVQFVSQARHAVLPGSTYTIQAPPGEIERLLWSNTLARTPRRKAIHPRSPDAGAARFVVAWGHEPLAGARMVVKFDDGEVWERVNAQ